MTLRLALLALLVLGGLKPADYVRVDGGQDAERANAGPQATSGLRTPDAELQRLKSDLQSLLSAPALTRALVGVRIESLRTGEVLFTSNSDKLVVPASNMKLLTMAVAAQRLGWQHRFETRLDAIGAVKDGTLTGDLIVVGGGDPSIESPDLGHPQLFLDWADALRQAGIRRVQGRIIGDDSAFDDAGLGAGWAWDYLTDGYAAPSGALSYNENVISVRVTPGKSEGERATVALLPAGGNQFTIVNTAITGPAGSNASISVSRMPGGDRLAISGRVPAGGAGTTRETTIANPTRYFVDALQAALASRGVTVTGGAWDIDEIKTPLTSGTRASIVRRESAPLSLLGANFLKPSQNFYGEMFLKSIGRGTDRPGTAAAGRQAVRETLGQWGISADSFVMNDGSGLSRYDYVTADTIVALLKHVWEDERLRGPFLAALPVSGYDGTLGSRMRNTPLAGRVQAKTGTISNMRALSGYLVTDSGERIVFSIIANHFTATSAAVDEVAEKMLLRLVTR